MRRRALGAALALLSACTWDLPSGIPCDTDPQCPATYYCSGVDQGRRGTCVAATACSRRAQFHRPCSASLGTCHHTGVYACLASSSTPVCNAICLEAASASVPPRGTLSFSAAGGSGSGWSWSLATNRSGGTIDPSTGAYQAGSTGNVVDVVKVVDTAGDQATSDVSVGAPLGIAPATASAPPLGSLAFTARGGSGAGLIWSLSADDSGGAIDPSAGKYTAGKTGSVTDTVEVTDSLGNVATATVAVGPCVTLAPINPSTTPRGTVLFSATGGSDDGFKWSISPNASGGTIDSTTGGYTAGPTGGVTDTVQVVDSLGNAASTSVTVTAGVSITPTSPSTPPLGPPIAFSAAGGSGSGFEWSLPTNASDGVIDPTGHYAAGPQGSVTDVVQVQDSLGNSATTEVTVTAGVSITPDNPNVPPGGELSFSATGGSGADYEWSLKTNVSGASIGRDSGVYTAGHKGGVTDVIQVVDSFGNTASTSINVAPSLAVAPANPSTPPGGSIVFSATGGSGEGLTWSLLNPGDGSGASLDSATGAYLAGNTGGVVDSVQVVDSLGNTATTQVWVTRGIRLQIASGDGQTGTVAGSLAKPLEVQAVDADGYPATGAELTWSLPDGATFASTPAAATGVDGTASAQVVLPTKAGLVTVTCASPGLIGSPVTFAEAAQAGPPQKLVLVSGDVQQTTEQESFGGAFSVRVTDAYANGVGGVPVWFAEPAGWGSISPEGVTDTWGLAQAPMTAGPAASGQKFSASTCGLTPCIAAGATPLSGSPVTVSESSVPASSLSMEKPSAATSSGDLQTGLAGSTLPEPLVVQVTGGTGRTVFWSVASGGGTVLSPTGTVDASGNAQTTVQLGPEVGTQVFAATLPGADPAVQLFTQTATRRPVVLLKSVSGDAQAAPGGPLPSPLEVLALDGLGLPVVDATILFTPAAGGSVAPTLPTTDANGNAQTSATLGSAPGDQAFVASVDGASVTFTETNNSAQTIEIVPASASGAPTQPVQLHAFAVYSNGSSDVTDQTSWKSSDPTVAVVFDDPQRRGMVQPLKAGSCLITGSYQGESSEATLTVQ